MKAKIAFIDDTEVVVDHVDAEKIMDGFKTANINGTPFVVTDRLIVQCVDVLYITFFE